MKRMHCRTAAAGAAVATVATGLVASAAHGGEDLLQVVGVHPAARSVAAATGTEIAVEFDRPLDPKTVTRETFWAFARWSGAVEGTITLSDGGRRAGLQPDHPLSSGESVMVILSHDVAGADGVPLRAAGYSFQFWTAAAGGTRTFEEVQTLTTRTIPQEGSRAYGGIASDVNGDRCLDLTIVNEDTADLRVFLNQADGGATFDPFLVPTFDVGNRASPSEPSDFNRDGHVDIAVCDINDDTVSILLGNGDGTFAPRQVVNVHGDPRGIALLDADGDGDIDIANTNSSFGGGSGDMSLLLNDGTGTFAAPVFFNPGLNGEWALAAADMDEDGILDLVVAARQAQRAQVIRGNGDGTFTAVGNSVPSGGQSWMLVCGDVNGDGHEDMAVVNSANNNGAILLGDGTGALGAAQTHATDSFPLATDLGDLDGDGDLDWITSSFNGDWFVFANDGTGGFAFDQELPAPRAASCALPADLDNDGDLDLALVDEIEDVVIVMRNAGSPCPEDLDGSGAVDFGDVLAILASWGNVGGPEDLDGSGTVDFGDLLIVLATWGPC